MVDTCHHFDGTYLEDTFPWTLTPHCFSDIFLWPSDICLYGRRTILRYFVWGCTATISRAGLPNLVFYLIVVVHRLYKVFKNAPGIRGAFLREPTWSEGALHLPFQRPEEIAAIMLSMG